MKRGKGTGWKKNPGWKKRFFARHGNLLFYFSTETEVKSVVGVVFLEESTTKDTLSHDGQTSCFQVRRRHRPPPPTQPPVCAMVCGH